VFVQAVMQLAGEAREANEGGPPERGHPFAARALCG